jgi:UDP-hydrolysing UDP-N-acetyl-D-glucosamine 2-epimerase
MRNIAVFTGTRAEYGLLYWILKGLELSNEVNLQLLVGGTHLLPEFGKTIDYIEADGFTITEKLNFLLPSDSSVALSKSMALALTQAAEAFEKHKPDLLVLLGDRCEAMALAQAALLARIPIAHIHGGELTEGAIDDALRHSITKMSHLHFAATKQYCQRIIQMGEQPKQVFNVGAPGLDNIRKLSLLSKQELARSLGFDISNPYFLLTYHPVTLDADGGRKALQNLLVALAQFPDYQILITYPNADTFGRELVNLLETFSDGQSSRVYLTQSMGQKRYLSAMKHCAAVIGNSSSGIIEAPSFKVPSVNIGSRQKGRLQAVSTVNCDETTDAIVTAMHYALSQPFAQKCCKSINPYGDGETSERITETLIKYPLQDILFKTFYDLEFH